MPKKASIFGKAPCVFSCPLNNPIPQWIKLYRDGNHESAFRLLLETNPFPAILGRVCYHNCERMCNRKVNGGKSVLIHSLESNLGDLALKNNWMPNILQEERLEKVLIIGSGPAGLSAAFYLRLLGYQVTIVEKERVVGGTMLFGIPEFRLPKNIIYQEVDRLKRLGVKIISNYFLEDFSKERKKYDAIFLATGALLGKKLLSIEKENNSILDAITFLKCHFYGSLPKLGKSLVVYGGGNTAIDVARVAVRLGCKVRIIYHRFREKMVALPEEVKIAEQEGVIIECSKSIETFARGLLTLRVNQYDDDGNIYPTEQIETLKVDSLVLALSQSIDSSFLAKIPNLEFNDKFVEVDDKFQTNLPGLFAGGDLVQQNRNVTNAVQSGRQAAYSINEYLDKSKLEIVIGKEVIKNSSKTTHLEENLLQEARSCYACNECLGCKRCLEVCPRDAIYFKNGKIAEILKDRCIGCGKCVKSCPINFLTLIDQV